MPLCGRPATLEEEKGGRACSSCQCLCDMNTDCILVLIFNVPQPHLFILIVGNFTIEMSSY